MFEIPEAPATGGIWNDDFNEFADEFRSKTFAFVGRAKTDPQFSEQDRKSMNMAYHALIGAIKNRDTIYVTALSRVLPDVSNIRFIEYCLHTLSIAGEKNPHLVITADSVRISKRVDTAYMDKFGSDVPLDCDTVVSMALKEPELERRIIALIDRGYKTPDAIKSALSIFDDVVSPVQAGAL